jgi:hypothetical protein
MSDPDAHESADGAPLSLLDGHEAMCIAASDRTLRGASSGSRCASGIAASLATGSSPANEQLEYPPGLRHVKDLTLAWN